MPGLHFIGKSSLIISIFRIYFLCINFYAISFQPTNNCQLYRMCMLQSTNNEDWLYTLKLEKDMKKYSIKMVDGLGAKIRSSSKITGIKCDSKK